MTNNEYQYPDKKDKITAEEVRRIELYPGYWEESEKNILNSVKNLIKTNAGYERFLDAGCGEGRLIPVFEGLFDEIVAIDPDQERLNAAERLILDRGLAKKTTLKRSTIEDFEDRRFDFILCSHVLQHVHTGIVPVILRKIRDLIKADGLLCITTCHSTIDKGYFVKESINGLGNPGKPIDKKVFNSLVNSRDVLPVHFFAFKEIKKLLNDNGFKIIKFKVFHMDKMLVGQEINLKIDEIANSDPDLQETNGRDMMIAAIPIRNDEIAMTEATYQNNSEEKLLNFKEVYLGIFSAFSMKGAKPNEEEGQQSNKNANTKKKDSPISINYENIKKTIESSGAIVAEWIEEESYANSFKYAEQFHLKTLPENHFRIKLLLIDGNKTKCQLTFEMPIFREAQPEIFVSIKIDVFLFIYPDNEVGVLFFNTKLSPLDRDINTDDIIFIIHSLFEDRFRVQLTIPNHSKEKLNIISKDGKFLMGDVTKNFIKLVQEAFSVSDQTQYNGLENKRIIEIRDSGDGLRLTATEEFLDKYPGQTYGLLVGDEGWRFVPRAISRSRIKERWSTRDFVSIIASSCGVVSLNFRGTPHYKAYEDMQIKLKKDRGEEKEDYVTHNYDIAGMDHGLFLCLEKAVLTRSVLTQENDKLNNAINDYDCLINAFNNKRYLFGVDEKLQKDIGNISKDLNKLSLELDKISKDLKIWEIENLYKNISDAMGIYEDLDNIAERLATHMESLNQLYTLATNKVLTNFNNRGLRIGIAGIIIGAILAVIGYYLSGAQIYLDLPGHNIPAGLSEHFNNSEGWLVNETFSESVWDEIASLLK